MKPIKHIFALPLVLLFAAPSLAALLFLLQDTVSPEGWVALLKHPQLWSGLALSLFTALASSVIAIVVSFLIAASGIRARGLPAMLAIPHLAFAIGFGFLIMPSGFLARALAHLFHWTSPPQWITTHDPYGLALIVALACKETAFLLFALQSVLSRQDIKQSFTQQEAAAHGLGHGSLSIWLRLFLPQLFPHLLWPFAIVFLYALTVVDMSLVLGPTQPPTFALAIWSDITSADPAANMRGGAGAMLLTFAAFAVVAVIYGGVRLLRSPFVRWASSGPSHRVLPRWLGKAKWLGLWIFYGLVAVILLLLSFAPLWPFPDLVPEFSTAAWRDIFAHAAPLWNSLFFSAASAIVGLVMLVAWLETVAEHYDRHLLILALAMLGLPALLVGLGEYRLFLRLGLTASATGLFLVHLIPAVAYMFILLKGPYRAFDPRLREAAQGLMVGLSPFLWRVKWPLLKAPLLSACAVGFAVAFAQYVPAQLVSAGRYSTLTIEAVTLSSGGNRALTAGFALLLTVPPLIAFGLAIWFGRARWGE